jgi:hypothetical protein
MDQHEMLRHAAEALDRLAIPYFVTGSFAGILYGEYRMTNDIDIVVELTLEKLDAFLAAFPADDFYVDRDAVIDAIKTRFQFNVIHKSSLTKVDFILPPGSSHDHQAMRRSRRIRAAIDYDIAYSSPEDLLLKKLTFHKESGSEKHLRDCAGILKKSGDTMDLSYIEQWADWLGVLKGWREVQHTARGSSSSRANAFDRQAVKTLRK